MPRGVYKRNKKSAGGSRASVGRAATVEQAAPAKINGETTMVFSVQLTAMVALTLKSPKEKWSEEDIRTQLADELGRYAARNTNELSYGLIEVRGRP